MLANELVVKVICSLKPGVTYCTPAKQGQLPGEQRRKGTAVPGKSGRLEPVMKEVRRAVVWSGRFLHLAFDRGT